MIATIQGVVSDVFNDGLVLDLGFVGIRVYVPAQIKARLRQGEKTFLYTHLVVREDSLTLYGFDTKESREYFGIMLGVNGIGPRSALQILSVLDPESIRRAVYHEQADIFTRAPGIGKKTAQKILLYLQDRLPATADLEPLAMMSDVDGEVLSALTALGYSVIEAQSAIQSIPQDTPSEIEIRLRMALQFFSK